MHKLYFKLKAILGDLVEIVPASTKDNMQIIENAFTLYSKKYIKNYG